MNDIISTVRTQDLRAFTVQIRDPDTDGIIGTGIVVSNDGKILTAAHVLCEDGVEAFDNDNEVCVIFPQTRSRGQMILRAKVSAYFTQFDDDVVLLEMSDEQLSLDPGEYAVLGIGDYSANNRFVSYGFCPLGAYHATRVNGTIMGDVPSPEECNVQADPLQLKSQHIAPGMSGAAVLDIDRNLVVGIISETWFPDQSLKHRDTAWAVNTSVLNLSPFNMALHDKVFPKQASIDRPKSNSKKWWMPIDITWDKAWNEAPPALSEWVGRTDLLEAITEAWTDPGIRVCGLIGFGGEGKSVLARHWLDNLLEGNFFCQPDGIFWWNFYTKPSVDEFLESALFWINNKKIDQIRLSSRKAKAWTIGSMIGAGRFIFVLDGLEIMQQHENENYGLLKSPDLCEFISYMASPWHESFCLITSRTPVLDLIDYSTSLQLEVSRLSPVEGRNLLRNLGVLKGSDNAIDKIVEEWDGYALILSLIGSYLSKRHDGDPNHIKEFPAPTDDESRYKRVRRVLRRYSKSLKEADRSFLTLLSAFRIPIEKEAFEPVFRIKPRILMRLLKRPLNMHIFKLNTAAFEQMLEGFLSSRILRYDTNSQTYKIHPLIRAYFHDEFMEFKNSRRRYIHKLIKDYYIETAIGVPQLPSLSDLEFLIEAVFHACKAGSYDEAFVIYYEQIEQLNRGVLINELAAFETLLMILTDFFPLNDISYDPAVSQPEVKAWILNTVGVCLSSIGRLKESVDFFKRGNSISGSNEDWHSVGQGHRNLSELFAYLGELTQSAESSKEAISIVLNFGNTWAGVTSLACKAWVDYLRGDIKAAADNFQMAEEMQKKIDPNIKYLWSTRGIQHSDFLMRIGNNELAKQINKENLCICENKHWPKIQSGCHRILGNLSADMGDHAKAQEHYNLSIGIAQGISVQYPLIEALLARGRWAGRFKKNIERAIEDLNLALSYAVNFGYRICEADIRNAIALTQFINKSYPFTLDEAKKAKQMSVDMGYHWGCVDAEKILSSL